MAEEQVDMRFVRESWEVPGHISDYVEAVYKVGLLDSERLLVSRYFSKNDRILDIGCGAGRTTLGLYRLGYLNVQGVDLSGGMIERAKFMAKEAGCPIPFEVGDATDLQWGDRRLDAALFGGLGLMCIPGYDNRLQALNEVRRVLRPGGHFIFTTHDRDAVREFADFWEKEEASWDAGTQDGRLLEFGDRIIVDSGTPTFIHIPTREKVIEMVQRSGLVLVEDSMRSELSVETKAVREFSVDCRMWVVQRPRPTGDLPGNGNSHD